MIHCCGISVLAQHFFSYKMYETFLVLVCFIIEVCFMHMTKREAFILKHTNNKIIILLVFLISNSFFWRTNYWLIWCMLFRTGYNNKKIKKKHSLKSIHRTTTRCISKQKFCSTTIFFIVSFANSYSSKIFSSNYSQIVYSLNE